MGVGIESERACPRGVQPHSRRRPHPRLPRRPRPRPCPRAANIVWWALQLQGSFALFWIIYFLTLSTGIGEGIGSAVRGGCVC